MFYSLVHYPAIDTSRINQLRKKYDPQIDLIEPHITIVFPIRESIGEQRLVSHVEKVLLEWAPFPIHLKGLQQSWDNYLFLLLQEGKTEVSRLHDGLYVGVLAEYRRTILPFVPHVTLGSFADGKGQYFQALEEATGAQFNYQSTVDRLHLVKINSKWSQIVWSKEFLL